MGYVLQTSFYLLKIAIHYHSENLLSTEGTEGTPKVTIALGAKFWSQCSVLILIKFKTAEKGVSETRTF